MQTPAIWSAAAAPLTVFCNCVNVVLSGGGSVGICPEIAAIWPCSGATRRAQGIPARKIRRHGPCASLVLKSETVFWAVQASQKR